jgi:alkylmercury lyase-like protein
VLTPEDQDVRGALTRAIAGRGFAPASGELAAELHVPVEAIEASLLRLADAHALLLHPGTTRPWVVHPFALAPGSCWVQCNERGYWANCVYCAFGIAAALRQDASVTTRYGGEAETVRYEVRSDTVSSEDVFHLSTPVARWWDNVIFACASFQPFRREADAEAWCARHGLPRGAVMTIPALWSFARDWYGGYLQSPWRKRSLEATRALFARHGLTGAFWMVD